MVVRRTGSAVAYRIVAGLVVLLLFLGLWMFLKHSDRPAKNNPAQSSLQPASRVIRPSSHVLMFRLADNQDLAMTPVKLHLLGG